MYPFNWKLPEWAAPTYLHKRLTSYLLKKSMGWFIKSDFALDTVDFELAKGQLTLRKLEIDPKFLNEALLGTPLQVVSGTIESINVSVPWQSLGSDPFRIHADGMKLQVQLGAWDQPRSEEASNPILETSTASIASEFISDWHENRATEVEADPPPEEPEIDRVGGLIDRLVANLKISLGSIHVAFAPKSTPTKAGLSFTLLADSVECFEDASPAEAILKLPSFLRRLVFTSVRVALGDNFPSLRVVGKFDLLVKHVSQENTSQLSVQATIGQIEGAISPPQFEKLEAFFDALTFTHDPTKVSSFLDWSLELSIDALLLKLIYQNPLHDVFETHPTPSHLYVELLEIQTEAKNTSTPSPSLSRGQSGSHRITLDVSILKMGVKEWLASSQYPPKGIPEGAFSFARDGYLPILLFDHGLPKSTLLLESLPLIGFEGRLVGTLAAETFHGLGTYWKHGQGHAPQPVALKLSARLSATHDDCKLQLTADPVWIRLDPRLVDRLEGFLSLMRRRDSADPRPPSPSSVESNDFDKQIMNDLDSRGCDRPPMAWTFNVSTEYLRVMIQAPWDAMGDDQEANHLFARVHPNFWVLDCLKPWATKPGPQTSVGGHVKLGYQGLDISLLMGLTSKVYGFLSVGPAHPHGPTPTLEIGQGSRRGSSARPTRTFGHLPVPFPPFFNGFSEGEVKAADPSAQEETLLEFKHALIDTSHFTIHCSFPRVQLNFTKETFDATQLLLNDLTSWEPRFLKAPPELEPPASPLGSEGSTSFYTAREEGGPLRGPSSIDFAGPRHPQVDRGVVPSPQASLASLIVSMPSLEIHLEMFPEPLEAKVYSVVFTGCRFFSTSKLHGKTQAYTHVESDELFLLDTSDSLSPRVIVSPTPCRSESSFQLTSFSSLELPFTTIKDVSVAIGLSGLDVRLPLSDAPPPLFQHMREFFSGDARACASSTLTRASVTLSLQATSFVLLSQAPDHPWVVVVLEKAGASSTIFPPEPVLNVHAGVESARVLISQKEPKMDAPPLPSDGRSPSPRRDLHANPLHFWESPPFAPIGSIECLSCRVSIHNRDLAPHVVFDITNEAVTLTCCRDSFLLIQRVLLSLFPEPTPSEEAGANTSDGLKLGVLDRSINYNILDTLEEDAYAAKPRATPRHHPEPFPSDVEFVDDFFAQPAPSLTHTPPARSGSRQSSYHYIGSDYGEVEGDVVRVLDPSPSEIIEDYFGLDRDPQPPLKSMALDLSQLRFRLHDFKVEVNLRTASAPEPSMALLISQLRVDFDASPSKSDVTFRLVVAADEIQVLDYIPTSTWRKFLAPRKPPPARSRPSRTPTCSVKPLCEYRLKFSLLPIRLFVDQDALNFLTDFFVGDVPLDPLQPPEPASVANDDIYFQYVEVGNLEVKLDYKPKHLNLRQLTEGSFAELTKVFRLEGAHMSLEKVCLTGVHGLAKLTDELISHWLFHIKGTQLPHMVSGVGPMRAFANLGSGVADLVLLPFQQYRRDGRIMKGVARGATSFARSATSEAVRVGASLMSGAQVILERADTLLRPTPRPGAGALSRYARQPENVNEGMAFAYRSFRHNLGAAARTILAVPVELTERTGARGSTRAVIRAIPIVVLHPMIGATQAISMALLGLRNSLDPYRHERLEDVSSAPYPSLHPLEVQIRSMNRSIRPTPAAFSVHPPAPRKGSGHLAQASRCKPLPPNAIPAGTDPLGRPA
ncbi:autophagy- protein 2 [Massospora cicadina]|nr:autophagy- protein 2 [Massospora cicadina]